ncbi:MAG: hypothetical protein QME76_04395 [Bacillota bacterium]|nr:hypothetical protein [Bacillota bacterium]
MARRLILIGLLCVAALFVVHLFDIGREPLDSFVSRELCKVDPGYTIEWSARRYMDVWGLYYVHLLVKVPDGKALPPDLASLSRMPPRCIGDDLHEVHLFVAKRFPSGWGIMQSDKLY